MTNTSIGHDELLLLFSLQSCLFRIMTFLWKLVVLFNHFYVLSPISFYKGLPHYLPTHLVTISRSFFSEIISYSWSIKITRDIGNSSFFTFIWEFKEQNMQLISSFNHIVFNCVNVVLNYYWVLNMSLNMSHVCKLYVDFSHVPWSYVRPFLPHTSFRHAVITGDEEGASKWTFSLFLWLLRFVLLRLHTR